MNSIYVTAVHWVCLALILAGLFISYGAYKNWSWLNFVQCTCDATQSRVNSEDNPKDKHINDRWITFAFGVFLVVIGSIYMFLF